MASGGSSIDTMCSNLIVLASLSFLNLFLIGGRLFYNVVLVSSIQQYSSARKTGQLHVKRMKLEHLIVPTHKNELNR